MIYAIIFNFFANLYFCNLKIIIRYVYYFYKGLLKIIFFLIDLNSKKQFRLTKVYVRYIIDQVQHIWHNIPLYIIKNINLKTIFVLFLYKISKCIMEAFQVNFYSITICDQLVIQKTKNRDGTSTFRSNGTL